MRRLLLNLLPKVLLSSTTGLITRTPLPVSLRAPLYRWFARRYGADLDECQGELRGFRSLAEFFQRGLRPGARPITDTKIVWPCDGKIVSAGLIQKGCIPEVKGRNYSVADLVGDRDLAGELEAGSQATIYLAPGDYHRVHMPFTAKLSAIRKIPGTLFPVNPPAIACIKGIFLANARVVFRLRLADGRCGAVVMVAALNVGDTKITAAIGDQLAAGDELGRFGFGSTTIALIGPGGPSFAAVEQARVVRMGAAAATT